MTHLTRAIRERNYAIFAVGFACSGFGLQMLTTVILWDLWLRTHDALVLGMAGLARALPVVALALVAGHAADRHSRTRIIALTQGCFVIVCGAFAIASYWHAPIWIWYALLVASGCVRSFNGPSRSSLLPLLVRPENFENAVAWNSGIFQAAAVLGPITAGALLGLDMPSWLIFVVCGALISVMGVLALRLTPREEELAKDAMTIRSMLAGMSHIYKERTILATLTLDLLGVLLGGATALLPIYADEILGGGPILLGWLRAAPYIGAFLMAVWIAVRPPMRFAGPALLCSVGVFGLSMIVFGLSTSIWVSMLALFISGAVDNVSVIIRHTLVQTRTPNHLRGRVSAVNSLFIECSNELGAFESGLVAKFWGPVFSVVSGGIGTLVVVGAITGVFPELRRLRTMSPKEPDPQT
ncbi:MAG: MFS transporter [Phycisphaerales bacterium]|nr:MFS transporter [Phycisphaerales bacterium]